MIGRLSLGKMAFSSWLFWLFAQKARLFWLFAKLGYIVVAFVDVYKLIYHFFHYKVLFTSIFWLFPGFCKKTVCSARLLYLAVRKWQNGNLERKIWAFSQKMRWLFWLFWLFLYLSLCKMAFSSLAFCQKSHVRLTLSTQWLFWLLPGFFLEEKAREKAVPIHRRVKSDFLVSVRTTSDFGVLERPLAQDGHSRFVVLRCMTWYSYTKVLSLVAQSTSRRSLWQRLCWYFDLRKCTICTTK